MRKSRYTDQQIALALQRQFSVSERRALRATDWPRSTHRHQSRASDQTPLRMELQDLAVSRLRYGYRRLTILLRRKGWRVNPKRIYRLDRQEGLQAGVPGDEGGAELACCKLQ